MKKFEFENLFFIALIILAFLILFLPASKLDWGADNKSVIEYMYHQ